MGYQIKHTYEVSNTQEISVEAGSPESENYNEERLSGSFSIDDYKIPGIISKSIKEHWEELN